MAMAERHRVAYRLLGGLVNAHTRPERLRIPLQRAHVDLRPDVYLSTAYALTGLLVLGSLALSLLALLAHMGGAPVPVALATVFALLALAFAVLGPLGAWYMPAITAQNRARNIDLRLPSAINYISIMAGAGSTPEDIFAGLARQRIYGEIADEAAWITRDLRMLGKDVVTALSDAIERSPSRKLQDFLQGAITTITSGGQLKDYFRAKSEQYVSENRQEQRRFLDSLSVLAESYVTIVVAGPVFLIVLLSVMLMFGGGGRKMLDMGYVIVLGIIPFAQLTFAWTLRLVMPEV